MTSIKCITEYAKVTTVRIFNIRITLLILPSLTLWIEIPHIMRIIILSDEIIFFNLILS